MSDGKQERLQELIHTPADLAAEGVQWAKDTLATPGIPFGVPCVDEVMLPMHPGNMIIVCGRPGMGKTSILATLARAEAKRIMERGIDDHEVVLYISWEQVSEEIDLLLSANAKYSAADIMRGQVDIGAVERQAVKRAELPIWIIGDSISRTNIRSLRMFPDVVFDAIQLAVEQYNIKPRLMCFDYLQVIPSRNANDKVMQVSTAATMCKELAKRVGCPAIVGAQAGRQVDAKEFKIPVMTDGQWSSQIEQDTDKFFGLWRPILTDRDKPPIKVGTREYPITDNLLIMQMSKQRFAPAGFTWAMYFSPAHLKLCELELKRARLNEPDDDLPW